MKIRKLRKTFKKYSFQFQWTCGRKCRRTSRKVPPPKSQSASGRENVLDEKSQDHQSRNIYWYFTRCIRWCLQIFQKYWCIRLVKDEFVALHGLSLDVYQGQICVFLGHNGAGKYVISEKLSKFAK